MFSIFFLYIIKNGEGNFFFFSPLREKSSSKSDLKVGYVPVLQDGDNTPLAFCHWHWMGGGTTRQGVGI